MSPDFFGGRGEEVAAAVPMLPLLHVHQPKIDLVNQRCRIQRLARPLLGQLTRRELSQFVVNQWQELLGSMGIALFDGGQDASHVTHGARLYRPKRRRAIVTPATPRRRGDFAIDELGEIASSSYYH